MWAMEDIMVALDEEGVNEEGAAAVLAALVVLGLNSRYNTKQSLLSCDAGFP